MSDLIISIGGDVSKFNEKLDQVHEKVSDLENGLKKAATVSAIAFATLTGEVVLSTKAFAESEAASRTLSLSLQNQGLYSQKLLDSYKKQAEAAQDLTGVDDDLITSGQSVLQNLIGQTEITQEMTNAALDLGEKLGSPKAGFEALGRAIQGQTRTLREFGIQIDDGLPKQELLAKILEQVNQKIGGSAAAANQGVDGIRGLKTAFGNLQEEIGSHFAPLIAQAIHGMTEFINLAQKHEALVTFAAALVAGGVAVSGLILGLSAIGTVLVGLTPILTVFGLTLATAFGPVTLIAAAVTALVAGLGYLAIRAKETTPAIDDLQGQINETRAGIERLQKIAASPVKSAFAADVSKDLDAAKGKLADLEEALRRTQTQQRQAKEIPQDADKAAAAASAKANEDYIQNAKREALHAGNELIALESQRASKNQVDLKKAEIEILTKMEDEKYKASREALGERLEEIRQLQAQADSEQLDRETELNKDLYTGNAEYQALTKEQKATFLAENEQMLESEIETEATTRKKAAIARTKEQILDNNAYLENTRKFGVAYAAIYSLMHSEVLTGSAKAFGDLAQLTSSSNATLKTIGQVAAVANIVIKTAESAMNIYAGFSTIPIIGPALGVAGAAAAIAFGGEQVGRVLGAADGGLITGGIPGVDSVPVMAQHGELVVPTRNFDEVVNATADARAARSGDSGGAGSQAVDITLRLKDGLIEMIEAAIVERQNLRVSLLGS